MTPPDPLLQLPNTYRGFYGAFTRLRRVQAEAIAPILAGRDLVVQAATGSGKSEAVLAPCLERVISSGRAHGVLYIIPTRALAMDLKRRFESLITERLGLNFAIRTGDVKKTGRQRPDIMFTTPESLDVMLGSANGDLKAFLFQVGTVIIDEVHSLIHHYRGRHLVYLFTRLERKTGKPLQKIAMSATIGRVEDVMAFFKFRPPGAAIATRVNREIIARLIHLRQEETELPALLNDLYHTWHYRKILIFVNSRAACDRLSEIVGAGGIFQGVSELHYSNLKPLERKRAEERFRKRPHSLCIATSTLELGIDVGDVDAVLLYQPPGSVSAFLQRIGRANRRGACVNFWGICCGTHADDQVVRFLALLTLGRKGEIEAPPFRTLPSVLSQQVISCLYEKKEISLMALQSLFSDQAALLPSIFESLEKKRWLKKINRPGLIRGGWQYRNHLLEYKIWGNFPEAEKEYVLEVSDKAVADIPSSIVDQMDVGDRVYLSGRRLRILKIDREDPGKVVACPSVKGDEKQLIWAGMGVHVSREVAQAMGEILQAGTIPGDAGLFTRTKKLLQDGMDRTAARVVLANGMDVVPGKRACFHYRTFLGSAGNLILEWAIRDFFLDEDLDIASHETGVECSCRIEFEKLNLPRGRREFEAFVGRHFKVLASLVPLNIFWKTLPRALKVGELTDFLFDKRVTEVFRHYLQSTSEVVSGDMANLAATAFAVNEDRPAPVPDIPAGAPLIEREKKKIMEATEERSTAGDPLLVDRPGHPLCQPCLNRTKPAPLTATMVSEYFFYGQCQRRFCLKYFQLLPSASYGDGLGALARKEGGCHEQAVLAELGKGGDALVEMENKGPGEYRFPASVKQLKQIVHVLASPGNRNPARPMWLAHCYLRADRLINVKDAIDFGNTLLNSNGTGGIGKLSPEFVDGIGIPDLLRLSLENPSSPGERVVIEVGDIKRSRVPGYHHKWQVAFYAHLLEQILRDHGIAARVSQQGFVITPARDRRPEDTVNPMEHTVHSFLLKPYLSAFPMLFHTMASSLFVPPAGPDHKLEPHCISCGGFEPCYHTALAGEDIQFLPALTKGELIKLRQLGCTTMARTRETLEAIAHDVGGARENSLDPNLGLTLQQRTKLVGWCDAFLNNHIRLHERKTRLFPRNISRLFFIHMEKDPLGGFPRVLAWQHGDAPGHDPVEPHILTMENKAEQREAWQLFSHAMATLWQESIRSGAGPHIFYFGGRSRRTLLQWGEDEGGESCPFLRQTQPSHWTDIKRVITAHYYMPAPGGGSLYTLGHIFGCGQGTSPPPTLCHSHAPPELDLADAVSRAKASLAIMVGLYEKAMAPLESQWVMSWPVTGQPAGRFLSFIQEEKRLKEAGILTLQEQPLAERMMRFRALGYLQFDHTRLDHAGRFVTIFKPSPKTQPAKFRKGDFLKLVPHGMADIQAGFPVIMAEYEMGKGEIVLLSRSGRLQVNKLLFYSLEEDTSDWNQTKLSHTATHFFSDKGHGHLQQLLTGDALEKQPVSSMAWIKKWLTHDDRGLNLSQQQALILPFTYRTSMIQGPPGTGKTHLLGWILIALILEAHGNNRTLRIGISALTHQAIDTVLAKVVDLVNLYLPGGFPGQCVKWGDADTPQGTEPAPKNTMAVEFTRDAGDLPGRPWMILGATGYGFHALFDSKHKNFPLALDWVIFDEASQVPVPQALLSLIYGRGNFLFLGDVNQLPPIVMGTYDPPEKNHATQGELGLNASILSNLQARYPGSRQVTLDTTYRMNREICMFPAVTWYDNALAPDTGIARARLGIDPGQSEYGGILDPEKPIVLVLTDHQGCSQQSDQEADLMAALAHELMAKHGLTPDRMALISPHRAQNNAIIKRLGEIMPDPSLLPLVDTVERVQGAERDVILFGLTASDPDHLLSEFLNSPNRLNVAMTRARTKLIIIGSRAFFSVMPDSESMLIKNSCFKQLMTHCRERKAVFHFSQKKSSISPPSDHL
jgi:superfamily II DNA/RNA helicase